ncbi:MAG: hypothetical protein KDB69_05125, partial [Acidimicrobiia bacterium]|nr:hypothetical protein [Acidimicrobiia bacterium]
MSEPFNPDTELSEFLRQGAGRDWAEEAAEDEAQSEMLRQRRLDLPTVAADAAHRGDRATAEIGANVISGAILATGTDYATIQLSEQVADVRLTAASWSFISTNVSVDATASGMSFVGLMKEHAAANAR